ncbi:MAG: pseudaminic acid synthase [Bacteroidetes bacterium]|nr:pseudaminic acid synthase [Bacteroidota bacterium]
MFKDEIKIENITIGKNHKPFIVAEMSGNHNQSLDRAFAIVDAAAECGAHAVKLQTYTADTITMKGAHTIMEEGSLWHGKELHELYKEAYTPWEWHGPIIKRANEKGLICFSSPFDETAVDLLESLNTPLYKIASFENTHHPLLKKVAQTGKPVIMSTGVSTPADIYESIQVLRNNGCKELILLKCTSTYPATPENTNLKTIPHMKDLYSCPIGLSDHTMGIGVSIAAVSLGAVMIEKHFTLSRAEGGVDSAFSMEPHEMKSLVIETERAWQALGEIKYGIQKVEKENVMYKRSIYVSKDINEGDVFSEENLRVIRPGYGLLPKFFADVLGKKSSNAIKAGTPLKWEHLFKP